jgi:peroxiredoxin
MTPAPSTGATPKVGDKAADHVLKDVDGKEVRFSDQLKTGPVVVIVLRGWPGYQCPFCTAQFADLLGHAEDFKARRARVLLVYPGPADRLREHAAKFKKDRPLPDNFRLLVDPDSMFSNAHGLRWDAPHETVYPATFVLDSDGAVRFARSHEPAAASLPRNSLKCSRRSRRAC